MNDDDFKLIADLVSECRRRSKFHAIRADRLEELFQHTGNVFLLNARMHEAKRAKEFADRADRMLADLPLVKL